MGRPQQEHQILGEKKQRIRNVAAGSPQLGAPSFQRAQSPRQQEAAPCPRSNEEIRPLPPLLETRQGPEQAAKCPGQDAWLSRLSQGKNNTAAHQCKFPPSNLASALVRKPGYIPAVPG